MKRTFVLLVLSTVFFLGCGKSEEEQKLESSLNEEVTNLLAEQKEALSRVDDLIDQVEASILRFDSLVVANPKAVAGHTADDLVKAKSRLMNVKSTLETWLKAYVPYHEQTSHNAAMAKLQRDKEDLGNAKENVDGAISAAAAAIGAHDQIVEQLKTAPKGKKGKG